MELTLNQLASHLPGAVAHGSSSTSIHHITEDSRSVQPGSLFVARKGERVDGSRFAQDAMKRGASAVLCELRAGIELSPRLEVPDVREAWGVISQLVYDQPCRKLKLVGITGTNGKTTVASLVDQALVHLGNTVARSGTLGFFVGDTKLADSLTTPMPDQLAAMLARASDLGATHAVLEVSSHALAQKRIFGVSFEVTAFTNLSQDHLDYHGSLAAYAAEKEKLFSEYESGHQVFNLDDEHGRCWFRRHSHRRATLGVSSLDDSEAGISVQESRFSVEGIYAVVLDRGNQVSIQTTLLGRHNLENLLVAWGILAHLGFESAQIRDALSQSRGVPGRLERCESQDDDVVVVVDYAHTPDALSRVLSTLNELAFTELSCVFGCGGDRDRSKRPKMAEAVAEFSDRIYLTSDNPRTESPQAIIEDILPGLAAARREPYVDVDRRLAITRAILDAPAGACVLLAGKGHEDYQIIGEQVLPFDDRHEARLALEVRRKRDAMTGAD